MLGSAGPMCAVYVIFRKCAVNGLKILIVHYDTSAMKRFLTSVSLQHEPKTSDVITLARVFRTIIVWNFILRGVKMQIFGRESA